MHPKNSSRQEPQRRPLADVTSRNNAQSTPPRQHHAPNKSPSSPLVAHHHQSLKAAQLQVHGYDAAPENKRISAITNESQRDSKRDSTGSSTSNGSGGRPRKRHIGPWQLGSTLGTGATGRVRKARNVVTGQLAAVKIVSKRTAIDLRSQSVMQMDKRLAAKPWHTDRRAMPFSIERETVIMKIIGHPNIIKLYDLWENRGELYLVMEYVDGGELFNYIVQNKYLDEPEAVRIFRQIISAVGYCHEFKVCHRDIKPENILLDSVGNVKLVDFGMASREHNEGLQTSCGSPHYASPEIALGQKYRGAQVDVWSCGIVLYVMLVGQLPFGTTYTVPDEVQQVLNEVIRGEIEIPEELSDNAADLICRMLERVPHDRIKMNEIWCHPLLLYYEPYVKDPEYSERWIGGPPPPLTNEACGNPVSRREDVDLDILRGVCTLWHSDNQERMIATLMSPTPNYQKVVYQNLLNFRVEQEENYQGVAIDFSGSDYHHVSKRPMRRTTTRSSLLGPGQRRTSSQFSIAEPPKTKHASIKSRGAASDADTEMSYDPFRPSRHRMVIAEADHAKITLLNGSSTNSKRDKHISNAPSLRHPAVARLQREHSASMGSSPPVVARDANGRIRELRRQTIPRPNTSSSWASTVSSREGSYVFRKSASYKRQVQFPHKLRNSSIQQSPPPRPRNPTPMTLHQRYIQGVESSDQDPFTSPQPQVRSSSATMSPPPIRSRKEATKDSPVGIKTKEKNRTSAAWEERTRQVSAELSNLCDEVFQGKMVASHTLDKDLEVEKLHTFARRSLDLPAFFSSDIDMSSPETQTRSRPLPQIPLSESKAMQTYLELAQTKERLERHAKALGSNALDHVIQEIDRLMATEAVKVAEQDRRRIASAPVPRGHDFQDLSPVKEEDEAGRWAADVTPRHVSEPVKGDHRYEQALRNVNAWNTWNYPSTIRPVDDAELKPRPLTIRKKMSEPVIGSPTANEHCKNEDHGLKGKLKMGNASTSALDKLFGTSTKSVHSRSRTGEGLSGSRLAPVGEDRNKENRDPHDIKRALNEGKGTKWFRRSGGSLRSSHSGSAQDSAGKQYHSAISHQSNNLSDSRSRGTSNGTIDDIPFRTPQKQKESTTSKILRFFGKRDNRMQIAMPSEGSDSWIGDTSASDSHASSAYAHGALSGPDHLSGHKPDASNSAQPTRRTHFGALPHPTKDADADSVTAAPAHSWFARFLHVKPAKRVLCLSIPRDRTLREIHSVLRDWRRYGVRDVTIDKSSNKITAVVDERNSLGVKPVTLLCEVFPVAMKGRAGGMAVARFSQVKGAKSSFSRAVEGMEGVLRGRGLMVSRKKWERQMRRCLREWDRENGMG